MFRLVSNRFSSVSAVSLQQIILNSGKSPIGRITNEFDKQMREKFGDTEFALTMARAVLDRCSVTESVDTLKVPLKMRNFLCDSVMKNMHALTRAQFLLVPSFLHALPSLQLAPKEEDALFDKWLLLLVSPQLVPSLPHVFDLTSSELNQLIVSLTRLRVTHQCKGSPLVRFFKEIDQLLLLNDQLFERAGSPQNLLRFLDSVGESVNRENFAPPEIRQVCMRLLNRIGPAAGCSLGESLDVVAKVCVWPEAGSVVKGWVEHFTEKSNGVFISDSDAVTSVVAGSVLNLPQASDWVTQVKDFTALLNAFADKALDRRFRKCALSLPIIQTVLLKKDKISWDMKSLGGLLSVVGTGQSETAQCLTQIEPIIHQALHKSLSQSETLSTTDYSVLVLAHLLQKNERALVTQYPLWPADQLTPRQVRLLFRFADPSSVEEYIRSNIAQITSPIVLANLLIGIRSVDPALAKQVSDKLIAAASSCDLSLLYRLEKQLSMNGMVYLESVDTVVKALAHVRKLIFRKTRMAPCE